MSTPIDPRDVPSEKVRDNCHFPAQLAAQEALHRILAQIPLGQNVQTEQDRKTLLEYLANSLPSTPRAIHAAGGALRIGITSDAIRDAARAAGKAPCREGKRRGRPRKTPEQTKASAEEEHQRLLAQIRARGAV